MAKKKQTTDEATATKKARLTRTMPKERKMSALDAAAKVLEEKKELMTCPEMIEVMTAKGYWTSPGGATPASTLYAAILREMKVKEKEARFTKAEWGKFGRM